MNAALMPQTLTSLFITPVVLASGGGKGQAVHRPRDRERKRDLTKSKSSELCKMIRTSGNQIREQIVSTRYYADALRRLCAGLYLSSLRREQVDTRHSGIGR